MSKVHYWHYTLHSVTGLNAVSSRVSHEGALIRVGDGFGCIHPWPELGDLALAEQLLLLREGGSSPLIASALACARLDGEARRAGRSLFDGLVQPRNHRLAKAEDDPDSWKAQGFRSVKLKVGPDLAASAKAISKWSEAGFKIRLDANESVSFRTWMRWWMNLDASIRDSIDFVEDPCSWSSLGWRALRAVGLPVAGDLQVARRFRASSVAVYKPATDGSDSLDTRLVEWAMRYGKQLVVTSYMDHAVGQAWAAYGAGCLNAVAPDVVSDCGLLTHDRFAEDAFFDRVSVKDTRYVPAPGTGLGFDELLEELPWKRLA